MRELELFHLDRMARASEISAASNKSSAASLRRIRKEVHELVTWVRRMVLIAALWSSGIGLHLSSEQATELIAAVIKSWARL